MADQPPPLHPWQRLTDADLDRLADLNDAKYRCPDCGRGHPTHGLAATCRCQKETR